MRGRRSVLRGAQRPGLDRGEVAPELGGLGWSSDLRGRLAHRPPDPAHALVASNHTYDFTPRDRTCRDALARIAKRFSIVTGELGEGDCRHGYIDPYHALGLSPRCLLPRLGWFIAPGLTCEEGPTLISDYSGTPTRFGIGLREHLRTIRAGELRTQR